mgnify:CR=1 FL=1
MIINLFLLLALLPCIVAINETLKKLVVWHPEYHRKLMHIGLGTVILLASSVLSSFWMLVFLGLLSVVAIAGTALKMSNHYGVKRKTLGLLLYPISLLIMAWLFLPGNLSAFQYGLITMVFVDGLTAVFGVRFGKNIEPYDKSIAGSVFFFAASFLVSLLFGLAILPAVIIAAILTYIEFYSTYGVDNLSLPLLASLLFFVLI